MPERYATEQRTLIDELPISHIRVDVPVLDGEAVIGFNIVAVDIEGKLIASVAWSAAAFQSPTHMGLVVAQELVDMLKRGTPTLD